MKCYNCGSTTFRIGRPLDTTYTTDLKKPVYCSRCGVCVAYL